MDYRAVMLGMVEGNRPRVRPPWRHRHTWTGVADHYRSFKTGEWQKMTTVKIFGMS